MASLKELRDRIASVKATQKITKAMQMVAAAKLRTAQERVEAARPYGQNLEQAFRAIWSQNPNISREAFFEGKAPANKYLLVICSAERGLCGAFNSSIARFARMQINDLLAQGKEVALFLIGKKGADILRRDFSHLFLREISFKERSKLDYSDAQEIAKQLEQLFYNGAFDRAILIYSQFISVLTQKAQKTLLIPSEVSPEASIAASGDSPAAPASPQQEPHYELGPYGEGGHDQPEFDSGAEILFNQLSRARLNQQIFSALLENAAGELGAKMTAMDNATRNAGEMIDKLSIIYNRQRQARITTELIEIIAGAQAI